MRVLLLPALLWPAAAGAETLTATHFARNFCWQQAYSVQHLAEHPEQMVTAMRLRRAPAGSPTAPGETLMEIEVTFRGAGGGRAGEEGMAIGYCRPDGEERFRCGIEGDSGSYTIEAEGRGEVLLTPGEQGMSFATRRSFREIRADEGDDRAFLLRRCG